MKVDRKRLFTFVLIAVFIFGISAAIFLKFRTSPRSPLSADLSGADQLSKKSSSFLDERAMRAKTGLSTSTLNSGNDFESFRKKFEDDIRLEPIEFEKFINSLSSAQERSDYRCFYLRLLCQIDPKLAIERLDAWPSGKKNGNETQELAGALFFHQPELLKILIENVEKQHLHGIAMKIISSDRTLNFDSRTVREMVSIVGNELAEEIFVSKIALSNIKNKEELIALAGVARENKLARFEHAVAYQFGRLNPQVVGEIVQAEPSERGLEKESIGSLLLGLSSVKPQQAAIFASELKPSAPDESYNQIVENWLEADSFGAGKWIADRTTEDYSTKFILTMVGWLRERGFDEDAMNWESFMQQPQAE